MDGFNFSVSQLNGPESRECPDHIELAVTFLAPTPLGLGIAMKDTEIRKSD